MATFTKVTYGNANPRGGGDNRLNSIPAKAKHVNDLIDDTQKYLDFVAGYEGNLTTTGVTISDTAADAAAATHTVAQISSSTVHAGAVNFYASDGGAAGAIYLPEATQNTHLVVESTVAIDGSTGAWTINTSGSAGVTSTNVFAKQVIGEANGATATAVETTGTAATPTAKRLIWTPTTANNALGAGSKIHFFAPKTGVWLAKVFFVPQGTGATGAFTTGT